MVAWPGTLPAPLIESLNVQSDDNVLRFKPDAGNDIVRAKYTAVSDRMSFDLILTASQLADLKTFFRTTTGFGVLSFDFTDPVTGATIVVYFAGPYTVQSINAHDVYRVNINLVSQAA